MKTDKIIFGVACLGMAYLCNSAIHRRDNVEQIISQKVMNDTPKMQPELTKDTVSFSKYATKDSLSVIKDSLKRIKK